MSETLSETVARLKAITNSAVTSSSADGISASIDQRTAARRLRETSRELADAQGLPDPRPKVARIKLT